MQTRRSTILGKRGHQESTPAPSSQACEQLQTPDNTPTPKRARTTGSILGDDSNKENIPPLECSPVNAPTTPRATRALRRAATEATIMTPPRTRPAPRRTASIVSLSPSTPCPENLHMAIATPPATPPANLLPFHSRVRALLRSTCNGNESQIAGRETERAEIIEFLTTFTNGSSDDDSSDASSTLFISGAPGTGKTALVNCIIRDLTAENANGLNVISINCMALKGVDGLWERMIDELSPSSNRKTKKPKGRDGLTSILDSLKTKCIVVLDELDHITPNAQSLTSIFTLTEKLSPQLRLVAIANTHTLTSSSSNALVPSNNVRTIHFSPYTPSQLQSILQSRLNALSSDDANSSENVLAAIKKLLPVPTLTLLTKKIAALTGDVRSLFEVLRGAIDLAVVAAVTKAGESEENPLNVPALSVTPQHILAALKAYTPASVSTKPSGPSTGGSTTTSNSETVTKIRNLGLQARLVLLTMLLASKRLESGLSLLQSSTSSPRKLSASPMKRTSSLPTATTSCPGLETGSLHSYYSAVLSRTESGLFEPVSRSEFGDLLGVLEGVGIASLSSSLGAAAGMSSPTKGRKAFSRSSSFGAGLGKNGAGAVGEVRLTEGMWGDEVLRGLGVSGAVDTPATDAREEEVRAIWAREQTRLARDVKAFLTATSSQFDTFAGAVQD